MFFTYIRRELRRRRRQAIVIAAGLGLGVGLVVTVSAMAAGVRDAQSTVLESLYGVGTDVTVTRSAQPGDGPGGVRFGLNPDEEAQAGEAFSRDDVLAQPGLGELEADDVATVREADGVAVAAGALSLTSIHIEGTFLDRGDGGFPAPDEDGGAAPSVPPIDVTSYSIEGVDVSNPDVGPVTASQITDGRFFEPGEANARVALLDAGYAAQEELEVGETIDIDGADYEVVGIAAEAPGGSALDVAIPLRRAQVLAGMDGAINRIYVQAANADSIPTVKAAIEDALPDATVTTADDLAAQVSGSLASAASLSSNLGRWLSILALVTAFAVASLLTLSAVSRRVREFGTLKALGWRSRRVVAQVMGESVVQGLLGAAVGIGLGLGGAALVSRLFPSLDASVGLFRGGPGGVAGPGGAVRGGGRVAEALGDTVSVPLQASVSVELLAVAIGLALLGALLAGCLGGWRAARLRPAEALRRVE